MGGGGVRTSQHTCALGCAHVTILAYYAELLCVWRCVLHRFVAGSGGDNNADKNKQRLQEPCVCVTTFNMIAHKGKRSAYGEEVRT